MVRVINSLENTTDTANAYKEYSGLSTDAKPTTGVGVNSLFLELNTNKVYYFDGTTWKEIGT